MFPQRLAPRANKLEDTEVGNVPGYMFADAGYDVWLLNYRASFFGKEHIRLDEREDAHAYYNHTVVELSTYDLPEQINYILKARSVNKVKYSPDSFTMAVLWGLFV